MTTLPTISKTTRFLPAASPLQGRVFPDDPQAAKDALHYLPPPVSRQEWISLAISAKRAGVGFDDFHDWSRSGEGYESERQCRTDWNSITGVGGITPATLFGAAIDAGWVRDAAPKNAVTFSTPCLLPVRVSDGGQPTKNVKATNVWDQCVVASIEHTYIVRKGGMPDGLRMYPEDAPTLMIQDQNVAGWLVVPCVSQGQVQTLQFIPPEGKKLNLPGATFNDGYHAVGELGGASIIYVVEGIGQAWACHQATESATVCTFGAGRMRTVALAVQREHPRAKIVLVPDRGKEDEAATIAQALGCEWAAMPSDLASNYDVSDFAQEFGRDSLRELLAKVQAPPLHYKLLSASDLASAKPLKWIIRGLLPSTGLAGLYGPSGSGKSFLTLDMAATIAGGGSEWFGKRVTNCPVTYCVLEGEAGMGKRVTAWCEFHDKSAPFNLRFVVQPVDLVGGQDVHELAKAIHDVGGQRGLVILDTLNRAAPGADENSSKDMGIILSACKELQELVGGLILLVHHTGKDHLKGMRGHSSLFAALDGAISVGSSVNQMFWAVAKSKDDATGSQNNFRLEPVVVGIDDEGDEVTSCVAVPVAAPFALREDKKLGRHQQPALDTLSALFAARVEGGDQVTISEAVQAVTAVMDTDPKRRRERAKEAIEGLIKKSLIVLDGQYISLKPT